MQVLSPCNSLAIITFCVCSIILSRLNAKKFMYPESHAAKYFQLSLIKSQFLFAYLTAFLMSFCRSLFVL